MHPQDSIQFELVAPARFLTGKFGKVSNQETKGLNTFIGTYALPAQLFITIAQVNLSDVNWSFLLAISLGKTVVFFGVLIVSLIVNRKVNFQNAGLYAIFCTQSNDLALGYPIVDTIYKQSHPDYSAYLYLVAPVSLLFLNPIGLLFMEISKQRDSQRVKCTDESPTPKTKYSQVLLKVLTGVVFNPMTTMTALGIGANVYYSKGLPSFLKDCAKLLGSAYSASGLYSLGLAMVGSGSSVIKVQGILIPGILISIKLLVIPILTREITLLIGPGSSINETMSFGDFGFLFGTFPTAPGVFVYADQYQIAVQMIATTMVACTLLSTPLMLLSAKMITRKELDLDLTNHAKDLNAFLLGTCLLAFFACVWVIGKLVLQKSWRKLPHSITLNLAISQLIASSATIAQELLPTNDLRLSHCFKYLTVFGILSSSLFTAILSLSLVVMVFKNLEFDLRHTRLYIAFFGWGISGLIVLSFSMKAGHEQIEVFPMPNPLLPDRRSQSLVSLIVSILCLTLCIACLIVQHRYHSKETTQIDSISINTGHHEHWLNKPPGNGKQNELSDGIVPENSSSLVPMKVEHYRNYRTTSLEVNSSVMKPDPESVSRVVERDECQIWRHITLLLMLCTCLFISVTFNIWTQMMDDSGIYLELTYFDAAFNVGQGVFTFALFGFQGN